MTQSSCNAKHKLLDAIGRTAAQDVLRAAVEAARVGDVQAMKIILDRVWPPRGGRPLHVRGLAHSLMRDENHAGMAIGRRGLNGGCPCACGFMGCPQPSAAARY